jgi:hypothetical protein
MPGKSFGLLPGHLHKEYLNMRCHVFFCKPHDRQISGKGFFDCEPLDAEQPLEPSSSAQQ